ncbi:NAD(P)-dependent dehydrogenase (short-subunit alcohol dehydrogenase family) [Comamonas sp. BIGb0124]|uniref:SDR family oxidoreductase n=1 Tax=Comamonas sp. BIGb0124 TaxID=2485130 RepID=UPI000F48CC21|nr:SDR family oxidoreductase [Comamonas sp. BIGb0124]ROR23088.1 NAD(P)-dependent dehydrogenase (short-subunit alcohol dehydrogenase family) [Comamonas sp. BIGb0124]
MDLGLKGKTALITGASKGIGLATAFSFAQEGIGKLHLAARSEDKLAEARDELVRRFGVTVEIHATDLSKTENVIALAARCADADILVNNAADSTPGPLDKLSDAQWRESLDMKIFSYATLTREIYAHMKQRGHGVIVNDIGNSGENWDANYIVGTTGNAAMMAFTRGVGGRSLDDGIRVVGVNPGPVATDRMVKLMKRRALDWYGDEGRWEELFDKYPAKRPAQPEEVGDLIVWLASDRAQYITGTIVTIDGGIASRRSII